MTFIPTPADKRTFETDNARIAGRYSSVVDNLGRRIIFYEKQLNSGLLTGGLITIVSGFIIDIASGTGNVNGGAVSWLAGSLTAAPTVMQVVYYDTGDSLLHLSPNLDMTILARSIILAYVFAGTSTIVRLQLFEKNGRYIFVRRQKDVLGNWVWDNNEDILSSGQKPEATFNPTDNRIYLSYIKDSISYVRVIEVGNEGSAWTYRMDYDLPSNNIYFSTSMESGSLANYSASQLMTSTITSEIEQRYTSAGDTPVAASYSASQRMASELIFYSYVLYGIWGPKDYMGGVQKFFVQLPLILFTDGSTPLFYDFYKMSGGVQVLDESMAYSEYGKLKELLYTESIYFLGWRANQGGDIISLPEASRWAILLIPTQNVTQPDGTNLQAIINDMGEAGYSASQIMNGVITSEIEQNYKSVADPNQPQAMYSCSQLMTSTLM